MVECRNLCQRDDFDRKVLNYQGNYKRPVEKCARCVIAFDLSDNLTCPCCSGKLRKKVRFKHKFNKTSALQRLLMIEEKSKDK